MRQRIPRRLAALRTWHPLRMEDSHKWIVANVRGPSGGDEGRSERRVSKAKDRRLRASRLEAATREARATLQQLERRQTAVERKLGAMVRRLHKTLSPTTRRLKKKQAAQRRVAAVQVLPPALREQYERFHSAEVILGFPTPSGVVERAACPDSGAFAGFMSSRDDMAKNLREARHPTRTAGGAQSAAGGGLGHSEGIREVSFTFPRSDNPHIIYNYEIELIDNPNVPLILGSDFLQSMKARVDYDEMAIKLRVRHGEFVEDVSVPFTAGVEVGAAPQQRVQRVEEGDAATTTVATAREHTIVPNDGKVHWVQCDVEAPLRELHQAMEFVVTGRGEVT